MYFLVQESGLGSRTNWTQKKLGWHQTRGRLEPPTTDVPPVPDDLLKVVRVNAKQTDTRRYTCNMHWLECSACDEFNVSVLSQELKNVRRLSYQAEKGETHVLPS